MNINFQNEKPNSRELYFIIYSFLWKNKDENVHRFAIRERERERE